MENLVGIKVNDAILGEVGFVTWGRVFDRVDQKPLLEAVKKNLNKFGITSPNSIELCDTLHEVVNFPYFYEALFTFSQRIIPDGKKYMAWCDKKKKAIMLGEEIYFLGLTKQQSIKKIAGTINHGFYIKL